MASDLLHLRTKGRTEQQTLRAADQDRIVGVRDPRTQLGEARQDGHHIDAALVEACVREAVVPPVDDADLRARSNAPPWARLFLLHLSRSAGRLPGGVLP